MEKSANEFFQENDERVNGIMCKIMMWITLIFPALFLMSILKVFNISIKELCIITPIGVFCAISPTVLRKLGVSTKFLKYYSMMSLAFVVALMSCNHNVGIYMTYILASTISCMYFDVKFTKTISIYAYVCMLVSVFIRAQNMVLSQGDTPFRWYRGHIIGYTMEYIILSLVIISIAKQAREHLLSIHDTEKVQAVVENCEEASSNLTAAVGELQGSLSQSKLGNEEISKASANAYNDCQNNKNYVNETLESINKMAEVVDIIIDKNEKLKDASNKTYVSTREYIMIMDGAVASMNVIDESTQKTLETISQLHDRIEDIEQLTTSIASIANETSMLSLNASIEAARAGENGKGFAVVAGQVRKLAEESHSAVASITKHMASFRQTVVLASKSIEEGSNSVKAGIEYIENAKNEAVSLGTIQENSLQMVEDISDNCTESKECVEQVVDMAKNMASLMEHSSNMIMEIKNSLSEQDEVIDKMSVLFDRVDEVSKQLEDIVEA